MELRSILLADAASVRESLLFVLGGGVTRVFRDVFPTTLPLQLTLTVSLERKDLNSVFPLRVALVDAHGTVLGKTEGQVQIVADPQEAQIKDIPILSHMVIPIPGTVPGVGVYTVSVDIGDAGDSLPVWVGPRPDGQSTARPRRTVSRAAADRRRRAATKEAPRRKKDSA